MGMFDRLKDLFYSKPESTTPQAAPAPRSVPTGSFARRVSVPVPATRPLQPLLQATGFSSTGGVQGLQWYLDRMKSDADGDVADEFLQERTPNKQPRTRKVAGRSGALAERSSFKAAEGGARPLSRGELFVEGGNVHVITNPS